MLAVNGVYENGVVRLDKKIRTKKSMNVIVTFIDEEPIIEPERLTLNDFSFAQSRSKLNTVSDSLSDAVIEERYEDK